MAIMAYAPPSEPAAKDVMAVNSRVYSEVWVCHSSHGFCLTVWAGLPRSRISKKSEGLGIIKFIAYNEDEFLICPITCSTSATALRFCKLCEVGSVITEHSS